MSADRERRLVIPGDAIDDCIGRWIWALRTSLARTERIVRGLDQATLDAVPSGLTNSIAALLYHVAIVEAEYLSIDMLGGEAFLPELAAILPWPVEGEDGRLSAAAGDTVDSHLLRLTTVRESVIAHIAAMDMARFDQPRELPQFNVIVSPAWIVAHLMQHEAEHRGEIGTMLTLLRGA